MSRPVQRLHILHPRGAVLRLLGATALGIVAAAFGGLGHDWIYRLLVGWDTGAFALLSFTWFVLWTKDPHETRCRAAVADPGRRVTWQIGRASCRKERRCGWSRDPA